MAIRGTAFQMESRAMAKQLNRSDAFTGYTCGHKNVAGDKDREKCVMCVGEGMRER